MCNHYLFYMREEGKRRIEKRKQKYLTHFGSDQFQHIDIGDTVWIVSKNEQKHLILLGFIKVDEICGKKKAKEIVKQPVWDSEHQILPNVDERCLVAKIDINSLAGKLKFTNLSKLIILKNGNVDYRSLQTMRTLNDTAAKLLENALDSNVEFITETAEDIIKNGGGYRNPKITKKVEEAAISCAIKYYEDLHYKVKSVRNEKRGYDLWCKLGKNELHVEVKGLSGNPGSVIMTKNEYKRALDDDKFVLFVVNNALNINHKIKSKIITYADFKSLPEPIPLAYTVTII